MTKRSGRTRKSAGRAYSIQSGRRRGRCAAGRSVLWMVIATMAAVGLLGDAVAAQTEPDEVEPVPVAISAEDPETAPSCAGTVAVEGSTTSEELIHDCETLLAARGVLDTHGGRLNWSAELRMRQWTGIQLDRSRAHVASIELPFRGLEGSIPPELADLTAPTFIRLSYNSLSGPIPPELGDLTTLKQLYLDNNELTGSIPVELSNLGALTHLQLDRNDLTGLIPPELGLLKTLRALRLASTGWRGAFRARCTSRRGSASIRPRPWAYRCALRRSAPRRPLWGSRPLTFGSSWTATRCWTPSRCSTRARR